MPEAAASESAVSETTEPETTVRETTVPENAAYASPPPAAPKRVPAHSAPAAAAPTVHAASAAPAANSANGGGPAVEPLLESGQIRRAIAIAQKRTDLNWSVFIGTLGSNPREQAEARHAELGPAAAKSVLIAVDPTAHHLEIVTGTHARKHLDDRSCALAAAAMTSSFAVRDLDGGIAYGILALVEHVRSAR
jgi:hypothetical protein